MSATRIARSPEDATGLGLEKAVASMRARFALVGYELRVVPKAGATHYDVRRQGESRTCTTLHDLQGFLAQVSGAKVREGAP